MVGSRQFIQSLQNSGDILPEKPRVAFYPYILDRVSCSSRLKDGSIKVAAEILISLTCLAGLALRRKECNPFAPIFEKSNMALLPVRAAIWITDGMISSGLQTKAMMGIRC